MLSVSCPDAEACGRSLTVSVLFRAMPSKTKLPKSVMVPPLSRTICFWKDTDLIEVWVRERFPWANASKPDPQLRAGKETDCAPTGVRLYQLSVHEYTAPGLTPRDTTLPLGSNVTNAPVEADVATRLSLESA